MSRIKVAFQNDLKLLKMLRDEIKLQAKLLKADARKRYEELEARWSELQEHLNRAEVAGADAGEDARTAVRKLIDTLKAGYESIVKALKSPA